MTTFLKETMTHPTKEGVEIAKRIIEENNKLIDPIENLLNSFCLEGKITVAHADEIKGSLSDFRLSAYEEGRKDSGGINSTEYNRGVLDGRKKEREVMIRELKGQGFDEIKSGRKVAKKLRQYYGRSLTEQTNARVEGMYKTFEEHIRPKPMWIPSGVWKVIQRVVLVHYT